MTVIVRKHGSGELDFAGICALIYIHINRACTLVADIGGGRLDFLCSFPNTCRNNGDSSRTERVVCPRGSCANGDVEAVSTESGTLNWERAA